MSDISRLRGVGPAIAEKLDALGIRSARELLFFLPSGYTDLGDPVAVSDAEDGAYSLVKGSVLSLTKPSPRGKRGFTVRLADCLDGRGAPFTVTYYNQPYFHSAFAGGGEFVFLAKFRSGERSLVNPVFDKADGDKLGGVFVSYPLRGLIGRRTFIKLLREAISAERAEGGEAEQFAELFEKVHFPSSVGEAGEALTRLAALDLAAGIAVYKASVVRGDKSRRRRYDLPPDIVGEYISLLPVTPTESQLAAMRDIAADLSGGEKMSRVVSGDVGSGKTLVAFFAAYAAARAGRQCAVMAPTEILAAQHAAKFAALFSGKISSGLLTASTGAKEAEDILRGLADGTLSVAFGTQSLLSRRVNFRDLATAVIDEQHKFGVAERAELQNKGAEDVLTLTATPIPRSLALALYDDIAVSRIVKRADAVTNIATRIVTDAKLEDLIAYIASECRAGKQAFIVCPSIRDSEGFETLSAESFAGAHEDKLAGVSYAVLHGRMSADAKRERMSAFASGELSLLIATSVVEVGVDTKASIMCVLGADKFGLASLHQLRGRVGRDGSPAYCFLHMRGRGERAARRLDVLCRETDGNKIAESDLELRGAGELLGARQSGVSATPCLSLPVTAAVISACRGLPEWEGKIAADYFAGSGASSGLAEFAEKAARITLDS